MTDNSQYHYVPAANDRRKYQRVRLSRVVKLLCLDSGKYIPARTNDLCPGGVQIDLDHPLDLKPGNRVKLGLTLSLQQAILQSDNLIEATVVRSDTQDETRQLALKFDNEQPWLNAAA